MTWAALPQAASAPAGEGDAAADLQRNFARRALAAWRDVVFDAAMLRFQARKALSRRLSARCILHAPGLAQAHLASRLQMRWHMLRMRFVL